MHDKPDRGLAHDLEFLQQRRRALRLLGLGAGSTLIGATLGGLLSPRAHAAAVCIADAEETAGPFPADGTNVSPGSTSNVLTRVGVVRRDIRPSLDTPDRAPGAKLVLRLRLVDSNDGCTPLAGYALYLWHCDRDGEYSLYTLPDQSWLRGLQVSNEFGWLSFVTIFPGCYPGRWPHMHFEVFSSLSAATSGNASLLTSQLAMPAGACTAVYKRAGYATSRTPFAGTSIGSDGIFADNSAAQNTAMTPRIWFDTTQKCYFGQARVGIPV